MTQELNRGSTALAQCSGRLSLKTSGAGFYEITDKLDRWLHTVHSDRGVLTVFIQHTSASLVIQENADPDVQYDLANALNKIAPENAGYRHSQEGPDDMPAHIKSMVTNTSLVIPIESAKMALGTWQGVYVIEHRRQPHTRELAMNFMGSFLIL